MVTQENNSLEFDSKVVSVHIWKMRLCILFFNYRDKHPADIEVLQISIKKIDKF